MMRLFPFVLFAFTCLPGMTQAPTGNEWIDYGRQYWRFQVVNDGLYRLDSAALANSGFPIGNVDPTHLMLFAREKQVPIYIEDGGDGVLNSGDFIEFFGQRNDGWLDANMYANPAHQANPYYSLYNDTIRYFLTWDPDAPKARIAPYTNTNFEDHTPRPWFTSETLRSNTDVYWKGKVDPLYGASSGEMVEGEGWFHITNLTVTAASDPQSSDVTYNMAVPMVYEGADAPPARIFTVAASQTYPGNDATPDHHLQVFSGQGSGTLRLDTIFSGVRVIRSSFEVPQTELFTWDLPIRFRVLRDLFGPDQVGSFTPAYIDRQVVSNLRVRYARGFNFQYNDRMRMWLPNAPENAPARIDIIAAPGPMIMYAWGDSLRRILPTEDGSVWKALVPADPSSDETRAFVYAQTTVSSITQLALVNGTGYFTDIAALEQDSALVIVTHNSLMSAVQQYKSYRETSTYNRHNTVVVDVDELYDQFGGGIPKHAFAIRRFSKFLLNTWSTDPRGLFLVGKSVQTPTINQFVQGIRPDIQGSYARCLVPTYGYPSSDPCFTLGLRFDPRRVEIPVGRLSASTPEDVLNYLAKVISSESQPRAAWMKNILHFRGGFNAQENLLFGYYMDSFKQTARDTSFGGNVIDFVKTTSDIFQQAAADSVRHFIEEEGVTLMNFFAHAYASGFDITIDDPANYNWNGKHPMVIGNSCYIGNMHQNNLQSTNEKWVLMPDKGPIAFLASVDIGLAPYLAAYTGSFYRSFGQANYGGSIGDHMRHAGLEQLTNINDLIGLHNVQTFTLQGDPTLVLNSSKLPDYSIRSQDILFDPATVTADVDTFTVKAVVTNIGKAVPGSFTVAVERSNPGLPAGLPYLTSLTNLYFRDTAEFRIPTQGFSGGQGVNALQIRVDLDPDVVPEMEDEANNVVNTTLFITSGDLVPAYPYDFAITPDMAPRLKASTGDPLAPPRTYVFQIDTTDLFNSPMRESTTITAPGGVVSWQPQSIYSLNTFQDSTVFFWRCSIDSVGNGVYNWYERSFQCIPDRHGWGQAHYFQFKNDGYNGIAYDRPERRFEFQTGSRNMQAYVAGDAWIGEPSFVTRWVLDLQPQDYGNGCGGQPGWLVAVVDPLFQPWGTFWNGQNPDHEFGNHNNGTSCRNRVEKFFSFRSNVPSELDGMANMLTNGIPDGHHVMVYSWRYMDKTGSNQHGPQALAAMEALGVPSFESLPDSVPFVFYVRKGDPSSFQQAVGDTINALVGLSVFIEGLADVGTVTTMKAGPARAWHGLYWNDKPENPEDSTRIVLIGVTPTGAEVALGNWPSTQDSVPDLSSIANAQQYPELRIRGIFRDQASDPSPAQMDRWQLLYSPVPECAIDPPLGYLNQVNDLYQGQQAKLAVAVHNISAFDMDSLLVGAWVLDRNNVRHLVHYRVNAPLAAGQFVVDTVRFSTQGLGGANTLIIEANPLDTVTGGYHQLEQYRFNNIAQLRFAVEVDNENPLLDVTFDGVRILDGDVVSARPEIEISLKDENTVLLMDSPADTTLFKVFMHHQGASVERIYFRQGNGTENMQFIPANGPSNIARIHLRPTQLQDGKYVLVVQARDLSNNNSGDHDHRISFEVINRPTITEVLNYPNPFTTNTRFVFTVTGSDPPTYMKIQIMTVTGRVVREVKMHEMGPIRVGRNITEFAWDGTDEFGDRLARGVYLYRVIAQLNGQDIEHRSTGASEYFNKGIGKMYLLR